MAEKRTCVARQLRERTCVARWLKRNRGVCIVSACGLSDGGEAYLCCKAAGKAHLCCKVAEKKIWGDLCCKAAARAHLCCKVAVKRKGGKEIVKRGRSGEAEGKGKYEFERSGHGGLC